MSEPRRIAPAPHEAPDLWGTIEIGTAVFPAVRGAGVVRVELKTAADWEQQKATGKDRAKTKFKGRKVATGTLKFEFHRRIYKQSRELQLDIDPGGPNADKVWPVGHPETSERGANRLVMKAMSETVQRGHLYSFSVEVDAWYEPATATTGGTKTPTSPVPGGAGGGLMDDLVKAGAATRLPLGEVQPQNGTGFDGPGAPGIDPGV